MSLWNSFKKKVNETWSGADFWDRDENQQQRQQFAVQGPPPPVPQPTAPRQPAYVQNRQDLVIPGVTPGLSNPDFTNKQQPLEVAGTPPAQPQPEQPKKYWTNPVGKAVNTAIAGTMRAAAGIGQDVSGLVDLATPGEGTNRMTDYWANRGKMWDEKAAEAQVKGPGYTAAQVPLNVASFATPGAVTSGASKVPVVANALTKVDDVSKAIPVVSKVSPFLDDAAQGGNKAAQVVNWATSKPVVANVTADALQSAGQRTSRGQDNSPVSFAGDVATSYGAQAGLSAGAELARRGLTKVKETDLVEAGRNKIAKLLDSTVDPTNPTSMRWREKLSPDRQIRKITNLAEDVLNEGVYRASVSDNTILRTPARTLQGWSREFGTPRELQAAKRKILRGGTEFGKVEGDRVLKEVGGEVDALGNDSGTRIWAALDPEQASKKGITVNPDTDFTPEERVLFDKIKGIQDEVTTGNLSRGFINEDQAAEPYFTRRYSPFEESSDYKGAYDASKKGLLASLKGRKDVDTELIDKAITDPAYLVSKRLSESQQAWAMSDYSNWLNDNGYVFDAPGKGLVQLPDNKLYGNAAGKYVAQNIGEDFMGFQSQWGVINSFNDIISAYDRIGLRQAKKQLLTVFNPAVRLGNQLSNRTVFATLNGLNPIEFNYLMQGSKKLMKNNDPIYQEAVKQGLIGTDLTNAEFTSRISQYVDDPNVLKKASDWVRTSYSEADDRAKLAAFQIHLKQGYPPDEAARLTQRGFQDYNSVGFFFDMAAKLPVIGNSFVRFAGDASRIMKNAAIDHPLRTMATVGLWATFTNAMSKLSGETEEQKQVREDRFGAPKVPFTDISLTTQTPWGEVNLARFMPFYQLNETQSSLGRFLPIQQNPLKPQGWQDPLLGQIGQVFADKDFRGKSIQDPNNTTYYEDGDASVKKYTDANPDDKRNNVLRFLFTQNAPLGKEADNLVSAVMGKPDIYGKERSVTQSLLRAMGVKIEQFGPEQVKKQQEMDKFFDGNVARTTDWLKQNPDLAQTYYKFNNPTRNRDTDEKVSELVSPERWRLVNSENSGRLFNFLKQEALKGAEEGGKPVDPIYQIDDPERVKILLDIRSRPTGDDIETEEILRATSDWYSKFEEAESKYYKDNGAYWESLGLPPSKQSARVREYAETYDKFYPKQSPLVTEYYRIKGENPDAAKNFFKNNADQLSSDFDTYKGQKLKYINERRRIEGYDPIDQDTFNNVTFGYEDDERKVARDLYYKGMSGGPGSGRGGKGGSDFYGKAGDYGSTRALNLPSVKIKTSKVKIKPRKQKYVKIQRNKKATKA